MQNAACLLLVLSEPVPKRFLSCCLHDIILIEIKGTHNNRTPAGYKPVRLGNNNDVTSRTIYLH